MIILRTVRRGAKVGDNVKNWRTISLVWRMK